MALAGADLTCENILCTCHDKGFTVTSVWPLGDINLVIGAVKDNEEYIKGMNRLKNEGRKYACIKMPNQANIPVVGYRIQKWCDQCKIIRQFDAMKTSSEELIEDTLKGANIPDTCSTCNEKLWNFSEMIDETLGINCPFCNVKLAIGRWFVNEREE